MRREPDDVVDVELVEADAEHGLLSDVGAVPDASGDGRERTPGVRGRRRAWWVGAAVLTVLAVATVTATVVDARAAAERRRTIDAWALPSLEHPLEEVWRAPDGTVVGAVPGGLLLRTTTVLESLDPATGAPSWSVPMVGLEQCFLSTAQVSPLGDGPSGDPVVLCLASEGTHDGSYGTMDLRSIDPTTGRVLDSVSFAEGTLVGMATVSEALLASFTADAVTIERRDLRTGAAVWRHEEPLPERLGDGGQDIMLQALPSAVLLSVDDRTVGLATETGEEIDDPVGDGAVVAQWELAAGRTLEWVVDGSSEGGGRGVLRDADGREVDTLLGLPLVPKANDGRFDVVCLRPLTDSEGSVVAVDPATGEERWRADDVGTGMPLLQSDGRILSFGADALARDLATGRELWRQEVSDMVSVSGAVSDGDLVVLPVPEDDGGLSLVAVTLLDGEERWRVQAPDETVSLDAVAADGIVLVTTAIGEVVALRSP